MMRRSPRGKRRRRLAPLLLALVVLATLTAAQDGSADVAGEVTNTPTTSVPPAPLTPVPASAPVPVSTPSSTTTTNAPVASITTTAPAPVAPITTTAPAPVSTAPAENPTPASTTVAPTVAPVPEPTPAAPTPVPLVVPSSNPTISAVDKPIVPPVATQAPVAGSPLPPTEPPSAATPVPAPTTTAPTPKPITAAPTVAPTSPPLPTELPATASPPPPTEPPTATTVPSTPPASGPPTTTTPSSSSAPTPTLLPTPTPVPTTATPSPTSESPPPPTEPPTMPPPANPSTPKPVATTAAPTAAPTPPPTSESPPPPTQPALRTPTPDANDTDDDDKATTPKPIVTRTDGVNAALSRVVKTVAPVFTSVPSLKDEDGAGTVTSPDLSTLDPIVGDGPGGKKKADGSSVIENDTMSSHGSTPIGGVNLAIIVVCIVGVVVASLFFVRSRHMHRRLSKSRDSSQQRALDEFFQANVGTTAPATGLPRHLQSNMSSSQLSGRSRNANMSTFLSEQPTPAHDFVLAGTRAIGTRFDDSVLRGTAAFRMNGPLPPSPVDPRLTDSDCASSERDGGIDTNGDRPGLSFASSRSSASRFGTDANFYSESIGDFRSTGGAPSMIPGIDSQRNTAAYSDGSAFSVYMEASGATSADVSAADFRLSSGVYSVDDVDARSSDGLGSNACSIVSADSLAYSDVDARSSDGLGSNACSIVSADSLAYSDDSMYRMSELSEGEI